MTACRCDAALRAHFADLGVDVHVSAVPPLIPNIGYETFNEICPHETRWYAEPTGEQQAAWARERVR